MVGWGGWLPPRPHTGPSKGEIFATHIAPFSVAMWLKTIFLSQDCHFIFTVYLQNSHIILTQFGTLDDLPPLPQCLEVRDFPVHSRPAHRPHPQGGLFVRLTAQSPFAGYKAKPPAVLDLDATNATSRRSSLSSNITATEGATNFPTT